MDALKDISLGDAQFPKLGPRVVHKHRGEVLAELIALGNDFARRVRLDTTRHYEQGDKRRRNYDLAFVRHGLHSCRSLRSDNRDMTAISKTVLDDHTPLLCDQFTDRKRWVGNRSPAMITFGSDRVVPYDPVEFGEAVRSFLPAPSAGTAGRMGGAALFSSQSVADHRVFESLVVADDAEHDAPVPSPAPTSGAGLPAASAASGRQVQCLGDPVERDLRRLVDPFDRIGVACFE